MAAIHEYSLCGPWCDGIPHGRTFADRRAGGSGERSSDDHGGRWDTSSLLARMLLTIDNELQMRKQNPE
jgi:hypothetical protein